MQQEMFMDMLGFPEVELDENFTVPQYMLDLHKLVSNVLENETEDTNNMTTTQTGAEYDVGKAVSVDMVHSLTNKDEKEETDHPKQRLKFHSLPVMSEENVTSAELRLFRELPQTGSRQESAMVIARAKIYQIIKTPVTANHGLKLLDTLDLFDVGGHHLVVFDVTDAAKHWVTSPETNLGLELHTYYVANNSRVNPSVLGLKKFPRDSLKEALMVMFSKGEQLNVKLQSREKRGNRNVNRDVNNVLNQLLANSKKQLVTRDSLCQMHDLFVDFSSFAWRKSVIAPKGYPAGYCSGMCPSTLTNNMNASHHARIQSLMHYNSPDKYPPVACVPVKHSPLLVLYKDKDKVTLKRYDDMVAKRCGCQ